MTKPVGLGDGGSRLWDDLTDAHDLDPAQLVQLEEACRLKDRLDQLDRILRGDGDVWVAITEDRQGDLSLKVDGVLVEARQQATVFKQMLAALRLPDGATGKRPQRRGGGRGAYAKSGNGAKVSSLEAARQRAGA